MRRSIEDDLEPWGLPRHNAVAEIERRHSQKDVKHSGVEEHIPAHQPSRDKRRGKQFCAARTDRTRLHGAVSLLWMLPVGLRIDNVIYCVEPSVEQYIE